MKRVIVFLVLLLIASSFAVDVKASSNPSWVSDAATIQQNIPVVANVRGECAGTFQDMYVTELDRTAKVCVCGSDRIKFGYFSAGGPYIGAVQFAKSEVAHVVEGVCSGVKCLYSAENDMVVTQQSVAGGYGGVVVYLRASERIKRVKVAGQSDRYIFDAAQPDYAVKNNEGQYIATPSFGVSKNGKWIVVELRNAGIAVIDSEKFTTRQLVTDGYMYGYGMDPSLQLAVSDDGKKVAVTGQNAGFTVIERTDRCGQELIGNLSKQTGMITCPSSDLRVGIHFPNFHSTEQPRFYGDGYQLEVVVNSWVDGSRIVNFVAHGAETSPKLKLLAFGDSFTSGEGEENESYYRSGTNQGFDRCHVSGRSYPMLLVQAVGYSLEDAKTVACAGATTGDIYGVISSYWGQGERLGAKGLKLTLAERNKIQEDAVYAFQPGHTLQSTFLERHRPDKLLVGIGGNDAGLMGKLRTCVMPDTCEWVSSEGLRSSADEIKRLYEKLTSLFAYISQTSPGTKVFVVGYPNIIDSNGTCDPVTTILLNQSERVYIERSIEYMNKVIRAAAKHAEFTYLDVEKSMDGKRLCNSGPLGMNGLRLGDDISISGSLPMLKIIGSETFHPTPLGHDLMARAILANNPNLQPSATCISDPMACIPAPVNIEAPEYWGVSGQSGVSLHAEEFATQSVNDMHVYDISIPAGMFEPGSNVRIEMRSNPVTLATLVVDTRGELEGRINIPSDSMHGFHTLHVLGENREGASVDVYQTITVGAYEDAELNEKPFSQHGGDKDNQRKLSLVAPTSVDGSSGGAPGFTEVLGANTASNQDVSMTESEENRTLSTDTARVDVGSKDTRVFLSVLLGGVVLIGVMLFLLYRRWAKQTS